MYWCSRFEFFKVMMLWVWRLIIIALATGPPNINCACNKITQYRALAIDLETVRGGEGWM